MFYYFFLDNSGSLEIKTSSRFRFRWSIAGIPETIILLSRDFITADLAATLQLLPIFKLSIIPTWPPSTTLLPNLELPPTAD